MVVLILISCLVDAIDAIDGILAEKYIPVKSDVISACLNFPTVFDSPFLV